MQPEWMQAAVAANAVAAPVVRAPPPAQVAGRALQLDGDLLAYNCGGNDNTTVRESRDRAMHKINSLRRQAGCDSVVLHLTHESSTKADRFLIATVKGYQAQRKSGRRPKNWAYLREWMSEYRGAEYRPKMWTSREADDGISYMAYLTKGESGIGSGDKDMRMLPGYHVDWNTYELTHVPFGAYDVVGTNGLQYGHKWFWLQMLQGDSADNIPGLPRYVDINNKEQKIGDVTAHRFLAGTKDNTEAYQTVLSLYRSYYPEAEERIAEQALLLWLRTDALAAVDNVYNILPQAPDIIKAVDAIKKRIKDAYEEARALGSQQLPHADA